LQSWKQRYFRLIGPILVYTEKEEDKAPKETYLLHKNVIVRHIAAEEKTETHQTAEYRTIEIVNLISSGTALTLVANNSEDQQHWYNALTNVVALMNNDEQIDLNVRLYSYVNNSPKCTAASAKRKVQDSEALSRKHENNNNSRELGWITHGSERNKQPSAKLVGYIGNRSGGSNSGSQGLVLRHHLLHGLNFKNGWLQKKGGASMGISALQTWKTRWFHLRGLWLSYSKIDCISVYM